MGDPKRAVAYPTEEQYERWKEQAEERGFSSVSKFIQAMTEAGLKKFEASVGPDETHEELREHRNDLRRELNAARDRIQSLEGQLYRGERGEIVEFVRENPGVDYAEVVQHIIDETPRRVTEHLEDLLGDEVVEGEGGGYYPAEER